MVGTEAAKSRNAEKEMAREKSKKIRVKKPCFLVRLDFDIRIGLFDIFHFEFLFLGKVAL